MGALGFGDGLALNRFGGGRQPSRHRHGNGPAVDRLDKGRRRLVLDGPGARHGAHADVEHFSRVGLRDCPVRQICRSGASVQRISPLHVREPRRDHRPLRFVEMPTTEILGHHETQRVSPSCRRMVLEAVRLDPGGLAGAPAIPPVEDHAFIERDRLEQSVRPDVGGEPVEGVALEEGEDFGKGVKFHRKLHGFEGVPRRCAARRRS